MLKEYNSKKPILVGNQERDDWVESKRMKWRKFYGKDILIDDEWGGWLAWKLKSLSSKPSIPSVAFRAWLI